ncbi:hypothetical protein BC835DRAFT_1419331 [Cytidiella melzeri]|nr:hypothetical protein BC835DRAFT_1419331 [Cytidiella melzeri]
MWTLTGPFEGQVTGDTNFQKVKLAKPGKEYVVGRKDCALVINHKRVSRKNQVFMVGKYSAQDVENPDAIPTLEVHNIAANRHVVRKGEKLVLNAGASMSLESGDEIEVLHDISISVKWEKVVCYCPPFHESSIPSMDECAKLGLNVVWKPLPSATHHVTSELSLDPAVATSLLSLAKFVTPDWLQTVLKRGASSDVSISLEHEFVLPSTSQYRPALSPALPSSLQSYRSWESNEARVQLLKPYRFIFFGERSREPTEEFRELVKRGGASYEYFAVQGGRKALRGVLAKGLERGQELVLVADAEAMLAAVGQDEWNELVMEAKEYELSLVNATRLTEAVTHVDLSYINRKIAHSEPVTSGSGVSNIMSNAELSGSVVPPSLAVAADEPEAPVPRRKLVRRAGSRASSSAPSLPAAEIQQPVCDTGAAPSAASVLAAHDEAPPPPRKRLVRRVGIPKPTILGIDDPSVVEDAPIEVPGETAADEPLPPSVTRPNRLKRRVGATEPQESQLSAAIGASLVAAEPPHKKYKALFDESDPDKIVQSSGSFTQPETPLQPSLQVTSHQAAASLPVVVEEEEESMNPSGAVSPHPPKSRGFKRRNRVDDNGDAEMEDAEMPAKRRASDHESSTTQPPSTQSQAPSKPTSSRPFTNTDVETRRSTGSAPGKPDRDEAFLKAVASTKRGRKTEDSFDREFNDLKISKPDLEREKIKDDWAVLNEMGDDSGLRGNFMVVVEMEVFRREGSARNAMRTAGGRADWEGRVDFKKFKKKATGERRKPIELVVEDDGDGGLSQDTWKSSLSQPQSQAQVARSERCKPEQTQSGTDLIVDSDDDVPPLKPGSRKQTATQTQDTREPRPRASRQTQKAGISQKKGKPLFLDSDEVEEVAAQKQPAVAPPIYEDESEPEATLATTGRSTQTSRPNVKKRSAPALIIDDDSDDGATFQGFGARKRARN